MTPAQRRRPKGDGHLGQRHDHPSCPPRGPDGSRPAHACRGRWAGRLVVEVAGRKRTKWVYGRTQKEARIKLDQAKRLAADGRAVIGSRTLDWWLSHWLDTIARRRVKPQTLRGYRSKVETLIVPYLGKHRLDGLQPEHLRTWQDDLRTHGGRAGGALSEASVRQAHAILRKALTDAVRERKLPYNPAEMIDPPSTHTAEVARLTIEQARTAHRAAGDNPRWWLALFYGMRQGEALGLRWGDVDLEAGVLTVAQTLQLDHGVPVFGAPKTKRSQRSIPLRPEILLRLRLAKPADADDADLVFSGEDGRPVMPWADYKAWHALLAEAELPKVSLHSARHTAADVLEAAGVPARLVAQILGHSSVKTTHNYTRAELEQMADGLNAGAGLLALERPETQPALDAYSRKPFETP